MSKKAAFLVMSLGGGFSTTIYGSNHNHPHKAKKAKYEPVSGRALWLPWPGPPSNSTQVSSAKPCQILWMVLPPQPPHNTQPPLIANPPSQPLIIPSHVANALLLTR